jgi:hypothetical protein
MLTLRTNTKKTILYSLQKLPFIHIRIFNMNIGKMRERYKPINLTIRVISSSGSK